jgi:bla regulator protein blaR1
MIVETLFWFHPFVWWIGARLVEERERACDEEVLSQGNQPDVYADAILSICKLYMESPLTCVSGVSGASIRRRIEVIMSNRRLQGLNYAKKFLLAAAGAVALVVPIVIGIGNAPVARAESPKFEVASVKACAGAQDVGGRGGGGGRLSASSGRLFAECQTLATLIRYAYLSYSYGETESHRLVVSQEFRGIPTWGNSDRYTIEATGNGAETKEMLLGPMLRTLLEDRFRLQTHRETKEIPVYELTVAKGGPKLHAAREGSCVPRDPDAPMIMPGPGVAHVCGMIYKSSTDDSRYMYGTTMARLCVQFSAFLDRDVVDKTGLAGVFDIHLNLTSDDMGVSVASHTDSQISAIFAAMSSLGLKIESGKGAGEFIVVDRVERPSEN